MKNLRKTLENKGIQLNDLAAKTGISEEELISIFTTDEKNKDSPTGESIYLFESGSNPNFRTTVKDSYNCNVELITKLLDIIEKKDRLIDKLIDIISKK